MERKGENLWNRIERSSWIYWWILSNVWGYNNNNLMQARSEKKEENTSQLAYSSLKTYLKTPRHYKKTVNQYPSYLTYRYKYPSQNISQWNPWIYEMDNQEQVGFISVIQDSLNIQYTITVFYHINRLHMKNPMMWNICRESFWQNSKSIMFFSLL